MARIGRAMTQQMNAAKIKPTHQAPTHTLLLGVNPNLEVIGKYEIPLLILVGI